MTTSPIPTQSRFSPVASAIAFSCALLLSASGCSVKIPLTDDRAPASPAGNGAYVQRPGADSDGGSSVPLISSSYKVDRINLSDTAGIAAASPSFIVTGRAP